MVLTSVKSVRRGEKDYSGKDVEKVSFEPGVEERKVLSSESGHEDDELEQVEIVTSSIVQIKAQNSHISKFLSECLKIRKHNDSNIHCRCKSYQHVHRMSPTGSLGLAPRYARLTLAFRPSMIGFGSLHARCAATSSAIVTCVEQRRQIFANLSQLSPYSHTPLLCFIQYGLNHYQHKTTKF